MEIISKIPGDEKKIIFEDFILETLKKVICYPYRYRGSSKTNAGGVKNKFCLSYDKVFE